MINKNYLPITLIIVGISLIMNGCGSSPVEVHLGNTFSNYDNRFRVLSAKRYTQSYKSGEYIYYDEVVFILLEWKCLRQSGQRCTTSGNQFSLFDKERNLSFNNITYKDQYIDQFNIPVPTDAYNCCDLINGGDTYQVYLMFRVGCSRNLVLKFPAYAGASESDSLYYVELPDNIQCKR